MSEVVKRKVYLTYPAEKLTEALLCQMYDALKVKFNIRSASVSDSIGIIALELEAPREKIEKAYQFFSAAGVKVEPIEQDIVLG